MTVAQHRFWTQECLALARKAVREKDWRLAARFFASAAHHEAVVAAVAAARRTRRPR